MRAAARRLDGREDAMEIPPRWTTAPSRCASCSASWCGSVRAVSVTGRQPEELADWANNQRDERGHYHIFGRPISSEEARIILRHPERLVTVRPGPRWEFMTTLSR